jgi:hypothetical protein
MLNYKIEIPVYNNNGLKRTLNEITKELPIYFKHQSNIEKRYYKFYNDEKYYYLEKIIIKEEILISKSKSKTFVFEEFNEIIKDYIFNLKENEFYDKLIEEEEFNEIINKYCKDLIND